MGWFRKLIFQTMESFMSSAIFASGLGCLEYVDIEGKRVPFGTDISFYL